MHKDAGLWVKILGAVDGVVGKELGRGRERRTEKEKKTLRTEDELIIEGNETADELANEGAKVDGGAMAAAAALTIKQLRE